MSEFIKIPKDFKSLHDLRDLVSNFELTNRLMESLNDYQAAYVNSMLYTAENLLKTIPKRDLSSYKLLCRSQDFLNTSGLYIGRDKDSNNVSLDTSDVPYFSKLVTRYKKEIISKVDYNPKKYYWEIDNQHYVKWIDDNIVTLDLKINYIDSVCDNKNVAMFLPNFKTKEIYVCFWVNTARNKPYFSDLKKLDKKVEKAQKAYDKKLDSFEYEDCDVERESLKKAKRLRNDNILPIGSEGFRYLYDNHYSVDTENKTLNLTTYYEYTSYYTVGGVWINGRANGYLSGGKRKSCTKIACDTYTFCTRTNQFLKFTEGNYMSDGWIEA